MRKFLPVIVIVAVAWYVSGESINVMQPAPDVPAAAPASSPASWRSGQQVSGEGRVLRILADDNDGSRHQRFILELASGRTLLVAHNIDLAPRIGSLAIGDTVGFFGEYEPNDRGGVIHWTHHDPSGRHVDGWLEHRGRRYQ